MKGSQREEFEVVVVAAHCSQLFFIFHAAPGPRGAFVFPCGPEPMSAFFKYGFRTQRAFAVISTTKCFAMTTNLLDHVQAVRSAYEAANSRGSFVGRRRITPVPLGRRGKKRPGAW